MNNHKQAIYQRHQIRVLEELAFDRFKMSKAEMMQRAGKAAFEFLLRRWPQASDVAVFCGGGNNGGDGYVIASLAKARGMQVVIYQVGSIEHLSHEALAARNACEEADITIQLFDEALHLHADVIVDALCGIGLIETVRPHLHAAIEKISHSQLPVLAVDIPSGIDADTGKILGVAVKATATVTFIGLKFGLLTGSGIAHAGEIVLCDLQLSLETYSLVAPVAEKNVITNFSRYLAPRPRDWHKGLSGHVLVIGGEVGFSGAPRMAGLAALRVGAGLVTVATTKENALMMNAQCPELMCACIGSEQDLTGLLAKATMVILGPGLGQTTWSKKIWSMACQFNGPLLIDADGLNLLAEHAFMRPDWVLTPHPGEAGRLLSIETSAVQRDRLSAVKAIQQRYGGVCVLKGAGTVTVGPEGLPGVCDKGNPGMATAGMGDILSGVIGGLMAQGIPFDDAAKLGVCMHATAGDMAAKDGQRGMMATDLLPFLRRLSNLT